MKAKVATSAYILSQRTNRILLGLRKNPPGANLFSLPGGKLNQMEPSREGIIRELSEEIGLNREDVRAISTPFHVTEVLIPPEKNTEASANSKAEGFHYFIIQYAILLEEELTHFKANDDVKELRWVHPERDILQYCNRDASLNGKMLTMEQRIERTTHLFEDMESLHLVPFSEDIPVMKSIIPVISKASNLYDSNQLYFEQL